MFSSVYTIRSKPVFHNYDIMTHDKIATVQCNISLNMDQVCVSNNIFCKLEHFFKYARFSFAFISFSSVKFLTNKEEYIRHHCAWSFLQFFYVQKMLTLLEETCLFWLYALFSYFSYFLMRYLHCIKKRKCRKYVELSENVISVP